MKEDTALPSELVHHYAGEFSAAVIGWPGGWKIRSRVAVICHPVRFSGQRVMP